VSLELVVLAPGLLLIIVLIAAGGRIATASNGVKTAAIEAARAASIARTSTQAARDAQDAADTALARRDVPCTSTRVDVDTAGFNVRPGLPAQVTVHVRCRVDLTGIRGLRIGTRTVTADWASSIDTFRDRR
jgi:Flp pilus assembly protein TadG